MTRTVKIIAFPKAQSPYQQQLYGAGPLRFAQVRYAGWRTPWWTLNQALLPLELAALRLRGFTVLHVHWLYTLHPPSPRLRRRRLGFRIADALFGMLLFSAKTLRLRVVWTVHNVLPHEPLLSDDLRARRALGAASDLLIFHSESARAKYEREIGSVASRSLVVPHPPLPLASAAREQNAIRRLLFFGHVRRYKGVERLVAAFDAVATPTSELVIAGRCDDPALARTLECKVARARNRVLLDLRFLGDEELAVLVNGADVVVLPFNEITTSGSAITALGAGKPLVIPDAPELAEVPDEAVFRYPRDGGDAALRDALQRALATPAADLARMSAAAAAFAATLSWNDVAERTLRALTAARA
ncbi:MAG TPA: glycosyltransferase [Gaiellaceae bacterium]|nr:glycosyltransferase [Gaiellaceae bacterium]